MSPVEKTDTHSTTCAPNPYLNCVATATPYISLVSVVLVCKTVTLSNKPLVGPIPACVKGNITTATTTTTTTTTTFNIMMDDGESVEGISSQDTLINSLNDLWNNKNFKAIQNVFRY